MKMFKHSVVKLHKTEKLGLMAGGLFIAMFFGSLGGTLLTMGKGFMYNVDAIAFIVVGIGYPIVVYRTINGYGLFKNKVAKTVKSHVVNIRTWFTIPNYIRKSTTDKNIDKLLAIFSMGICKYFDKDINKIDTVIILLTDISQTPNELMPGDRMFAEWLNNAGVYYLMNICNSNFSNNSELDNQLEAIYLAFEEELQFGISAGEKEALRVILMKNITELPRVLSDAYTTQSTLFNNDVQYFGHQ